MLLWFDYFRVLALVAYFLASVLYSYANRNWTVAALVRHVHARGVSGLPRLLPQMHRGKAMLIWLSMAMDTTTTNDHL